MKNLILFLMLNCSFSFCQTVGNGDGISTDIQAGIVMREVPIQGSPYMNEIYKKGETIINDKTQTTALMRYDAYNDAIEILDKNRNPRKLLRRPNIKATFDGKTYLVLEYLETGRTKMGYFNPLNQGETVLLFKPKKKFVQAEKPEHGYDDYDPPTYRDVSAYYIKKGDEPAQEIRLSKRDLLKSMDDKKSLLKKFISEHSLNLRKESDVIKLLGYYNRIKKTVIQENIEAPIGVGI